MTDLDAATHDNSIALISPELGETGTTVLALVLPHGSFPSGPEPVGQRSLVMFAPTAALRLAPAHRRCGVSEVNRGEVRVLQQPPRLVLRAVTSGHEEHAIASRGPRHGWHDDVLSCRVPDSPGRHVRTEVHGKGQLELSWEFARRRWA